MALLFALILWIYLDQRVVLRLPHRLDLVVESEESIRDSSSIDEGFFIVIPSKLMVVEGPEEENLEVVLSGPIEANQIKLKGRRHITLSDMKSKDEKKVTIEFVRDQFDALEDRETIRVEQFNPPNLHLTLARRATAEISLGRDNLVLDGLEELEKEGVYIEEDILFDPNIIIIEGPANEIREIERDPSLLKLERMDLTGRPRRMKIDRNLPLHQDMKDKKISIRSDFEEVGVTVIFKEEEEERILEGVEVLVFFQNEPVNDEERKKLVLDPDIIKIRLRCPRSQIDYLREDDILRQKVIARIDLDEVDSTRSLSFDQIISGEYSHFTFTVKVFSEIAQDSGVFFEPEPNAIVIKKANPE
jgi:hypothetical protein